MSSNMQIAPTPEMLVAATTPINGSDATSSPLELVAASTNNGNGNGNSGLCGSLPLKRGSMTSTAGFLLANNNNIIARRPRTLFLQATSKKEGCGKADHCPHHRAPAVVEAIADVEMTLDNDINNDINNNNNNNNDDVDNEDDSSSISSDSLDDYRSAFSNLKDDLFWSEDGSSGTKGGGSSIVTTPGVPGGAAEHVLEYIQTELYNHANSVVEQQHQIHSRTQQSLVGWNVPKTSCSPLSSPVRQQPPLQTVFASTSTVVTPFSKCTAPCSSSPASATPRQIARRNQKLVKAMQLIINLNETAIDYYRAGEYDATLDALREAEGRRRKLGQTLTLERNTTCTSGVAENRVGCQAASTAVDGIVASGAKTGAPSCSLSLSTDSNSNDQGDGTAAPGVARTSYIYQRMDFDEGMHSFSNAESIDPSKFWLVGPDQMNLQNDCFKCHELSPIVESTLVFNVGQVHRRRGEFDAAAKSYDRALDILKMSDCSSDDEVVMHPIVIPILHNIGQLQYRRGDLALAMATYSSSLKHANILYGPRHVHAASALNCLGVLHYHANSSETEEESLEDDDAQGKNKRGNGSDDRSSTRKAMELFRQALSIRTERLGSDHVDVATTLNNIGRIHVQQDEFDEALHFYEDALVIRRDRLGTNSLDYAATAFNAGQSLHQKGDLDQAVELYREFLRVALMKFGHSHRDVAVVLSGIAQIHQEKREYDKALELYEESLCAGRAALGEYHSEIAMLLNRMGNFYFERERLDDALRCYKRGLRIEKRVLPPDHPNIVVTLSNLGEIHRQRNDWDDAANMYCDALEILRKKHENHVDIASTLNTIGLIHDQRGDTCLSLRYLQEALLMRRKLLGDDHLDVSATLVYIGTILYRKSVFSVAMELFSEALRIRRAVLGRDHRDVAFALYNIALVHQQRGCYDQAVEFYAETLRVEKIVLGDRHRDVSMTLFKLGEVNKAAGDLDEALQCFQNSLDIERSLSDNTNSSSPNTEAVRRQQQSSSDPAAMARTLNEIGNIHLNRGDVVPMMEAFNEASRLYRTAGLSPNNVVVSGHLYALEFSCPEAAPAA